jgi:hypothetical protein
MYIQNVTHTLKPTRSATLHIPTFSAITKTYQDSVSGYTVRQIEDAIDNQRKWNDWRDNIKNKYNNATETNLDAAFDYWNSK